MDFTATPLVSDDKEIDARNIVDRSGQKTLKTIGIYGANGSGKSNIIKGLRVFKQLVQSSLALEGLNKVWINPFRLSNENIENGGYFQITLFLNEKLFRYGVSLNRDGTISQEWLYGIAEKKETWYFKRMKQEISCNKEWFNEGIGVPLDKLRKETLFITFVSSYNGPISNSIREYVSTNIVFDDNYLKYESQFLGRSIFQKNSMLTNQLVMEGKNEFVLNWLRNAGLFYDHITIENGSESSDEKVFLQKNFYDNVKKTTGSSRFLLNEDESDGTQKFYVYIGRLSNLFQNGGIFISDEIDNNFHPSLLMKIISFFNNNEFNFAGAQLLFTSHDTNLLNPDILRRDQIYFTEKAITDETILYSLSDLKGIRNNADFARQYLAGFYGAMPILNNFKESKEDSSTK